MATVEEVLALVRQLTPEEQDELIDRLFVEDEDAYREFDSDYRRELPRRVRELESGEAQTIPWEQVRDETMARFGLKKSLHP